MHTNMYSGSYTIHANIYASSRVTCKGIFHITSIKEIYTVNYFGGIAFTNLICTMYTYAIWATLLQPFEFKPKRQKEFFSPLFTIECLIQI